MADRDLYAQRDALRHVLSSLQREVRTLKARAGRPGAVRVDTGNADAPVLFGSTNNTLVTLNEIRLDPGRWVLFASGEADVNAGAFTGREVFGSFIMIVPAVGATFSVATTSNSPLSVPGGGGTYAVSWTIFGIHLAEEPFTVVHQGRAGDWGGSVHAMTWNRTALLALPM